METRASVEFGTSEDGATLIFRELWQPPSIEIQVSMGGAGCEWALPLMTVLGALDGDVLVNLEQAITKELERREEAIAV